MKTTTKKTNWKKIGLLAALGAMGLVFAVKATAGTAPQEMIITNHDKDWDYRLYNGRWYTRKKDATEWIDMQNALSPENYELAISRLTNFINANQ
jgi:hypothetical protein